MPDEQDRRGAPRVKVFEISILATDGTQHRAHLLDISAEGARVHCTHPLAPGQTVRLIREGHQRRATVRWSGGQRVGLRFVDLSSPAGDSTQEPS